MMFISDISTETDTLTHRARFSSLTEHILQTLASSDAVSWSDLGLALMAWARCWHRSPSSLCPGVLTLCNNVYCDCLSPLPYQLLAPSPKKLAFPLARPGCWAAACAGRGADNSQGQPGDKQGAVKGARGCVSPPVWPWSAHNVTTVAIWAPEEPPMWPCVLSQASYSSGPHWTLVRTSGQDFHFTIYFQISWLILLNGN